MERDRGPRIKGTLSSDHVIVGGNSLTISGTIIGLARNDNGRNNQSLSTGIITFYSAIIVYFLI